MTKTAYQQMDKVYKSKDDYQPKTKNKFYTEISLGITIDSDLTLDKIQQQLDVVKAQLKLVQRDNSVIDTNVLEIWDIAQLQDWEVM